MNNRSNHSTFQPFNDSRALRVAFKEWAIVCRAIASGRQTIILRKGGISEKRGGFEVEHREFLLFPTLFHQQNEAVIPEARADLDFGEKSAVTLSVYAAVEYTERLTDWEIVRALAPFHIWTEEMIKDRFGWGKENAITLIVCRFFKLPDPQTLPLKSEYGGCTSWVTLEKEISTAGAIPILSDAEFTARKEKIQPEVK